jgi:hypothetical protein
LLSGSGAIIKSSSTRRPAPSQTATATAALTALAQQLQQEKQQRPLQRQQYKQQQNSMINSSRTALSTATEQHYQQQQNSIINSNSCFNINIPPSYVERLQYGTTEKTLARTVRCSSDMRRNIFPLP